MSVQHDSYATICGDAILSKIRSADVDFKQIFSTSMVKTGDWDWPRPDYVCFDEDEDASYALEFKPPFQSKREYLTGLGQAIAYLQKHTYSGLILPVIAIDNFRIAEFIYDTLEAPEFADVAISLFEYDIDACANVRILHKIKNKRQNFKSADYTKEQKTFWCWWRDITNYEVYDLLDLSCKYNDESGDIYSQYIYNEFYDRLLYGAPYQWNGTPRQKNGSPQSRASEKQNYNIPLVQLGLWTRGEGRLTDLGFETLIIGKKYGAHSSQFLDKIANLVLTVGRHLELINIVEKFQRIHNVPNNVNDYLKQLEVYLTEQGCIGKRKPTAVSTGAKNSYLRDEMKLWNKLGLLETQGTKYFFPNEGYKFRWDRITQLVMKY